MNQKSATSAVMVGLGASLVGVCFMLPWVDFGLIKVTGFDLARIEYYLWLLPLAALLGLGWAVYVGYQGHVDQTSAFVGGGLAVLALLSICILPLRASTLPPDLIPTAEVFKALSYGFWGTAAGVAMVLIGAVLAFTAVQPGYGGMPVPYPGPTVPMPPPQPTMPPPPPLAPPRPTVPAAPPPSPRPAAAPAPRREPTVPIGVPAQPVGWLVARSGGRSGQSFGLKRGNNTVGRDPQRADVVLDEPTVSGEHARVRYEGGQFYLYDLASSNGTFVNNRRVQRQMLMDSDVVRFGNAELVFKKV